MLHRENLIAVLDDVEIDHLNFAWHRLDPWPDAIAGLERLKRNHTLVTLSNGNVSLMVNLARHGGLSWDAVLGAEVVQAYKPESKAYQRNAELLGLEPDQCLMVAAHNGDLVAASAEGFQTAFVYRRTEYGPDQETNLAPVGDYDVIAEDFIDLADQLGC